MKQRNYNFKEIPRTESVNVAQSSRFDLELVLKMSQANQRAVSNRTTNHYDDQNDINMTPK